MARIKARILQITRDAILVEVRGKAWLPKADITRPSPGEIIKGAILNLSIPRRLAAKKGLAKPIFQVPEQD